MKPLLNDHYSYRVIWSEEDKEYVGLCANSQALAGSPLLLKKLFMEFEKLLRRRSWI